MRLLVVDLVEKLTDAIETSRQLDRSVREAVDASPMPPPRGALQREEELIAHERGSDFSEVAVVLFVAQPRPPLAGPPQRSVRHLRDLELSSVEASESH